MDRQTWNQVYSLGLLKSKQGKNAEPLPCNANNLVLNIIYRSFQ